MKRWVILALGAALVAGVLEGCANNPASKSEPSPSVQQHAGEDVQSEDERQMVMLFQGLIRMDRQADLAISKQQAEALLPYVQKGKDAGGISKGEREQVIELLHDSQQTYLENEAKQTAQRIRQHNSAVSRDNLSPEERQQMIEQFEQHRKENQDDSSAARPQGSDRYAASSRSGMGKSVEQQLLELLQSKQ
ncbi:hypothetical protein [Paenibacillus hexagrammi]|uniref:Lipoprotein n=1 Tax=Paenibacillus hexagrammi TaxID=2908839 RepID=A0ABY3SPQ4_9BACL|nr:hypothetical protein [Paenibacillus sp. YPD9-1]UJF36037.1 hypothetical protein L0M14_13745 [Paenibacillus sp. YPD9-1]